MFTCGTIQLPDASAGPQGLFTLYPAGTLPNHGGPPAYVPPSVTTDPTLDASPPEAWFTQLAASNIQITDEGHTMRFFVRLDHTYLDDLGLGDFHPAAGNTYVTIGLLPPSSLPAPPVALPPMRGQFEITPKAGPDCINSAWLISGGDEFPPDLTADPVTKSGVFVAMNVMAKAENPIFLPFLSQPSEWAIEWIIPSKTGAPPLQFRAPDLLLPDGVQAAPTV